MGIHSEFDTYFCSGSFAVLLITDSFTVIQRIFDEVVVSSVPPAILTSNNLLTDEPYVTLLLRFPHTIYLLFLRDN